MERWNAKDMLDVGLKLFEKIYKRKRHAHPNHDIHILAREKDDWLPAGIESIKDGR